MISRYKNTNFCFENHPVLSKNTISIALPNNFWF